MDYNRYRVIICRNVTDFNNEINKHADLGYFIIEKTLKLIESKDGIEFFFVIMTKD